MSNKILAHRILFYFRVRELPVSNKLAQTDPEAAAEALFNTRPYLPKAGLCYVQYSINDPAYRSIATAPPDVEIDYIDIKIGETKEIVQRRADYEAKCKERLVHLSLAAAKSMPTPCIGCYVRHREHFSEYEVGGLEGVAAIIEMWLIRMGELPQRHPLYD
ncbi:hypothetical protein B0H11DRAFT_1910436 [Mycena galericulata]|nr:hypothetical protein B0H11DRAFT_1910436 [Mycena galericulata]